MGMGFTSTVEEVSSTRRRFRIAVDSKSVADAFQTAVQEVQQNANVRGFRKGKVPTALVRKFFEDDVRKKAMEKVVEGSYQNAISKSELQIVSYPHIEADGNFQDGSEFKFSATVDVNPMVEIKGYKELKLKYDGKTVDDAAVQKEIESLARAVGTFEKVEEKRAAQKSDIAIVSYEGKVDGKPVKGGPVKNQRLELERAQLLPEFEAAIVGTRPGETKTFKVTYPSNYNEPTLAGKTAEFTLTLDHLEKVVLPTLDDELAKKFGTSSMEELKKSVREMLTRGAEEQKVQALQEQIVEQILAKNDFEVPESLVDNTIDRSIEMANNEGNERLDPKNEEVRAKYRDWARNQVRGVLALGHVARAEGITVDDKELGPELVAFARSMGMDAQTLLKQGGQQIVEEVRGRVLLTKTVKRVIELNKV